MKREAEAGMGMCWVARREEIRGGWTQQGRMAAVVRAALLVEHKLAKGAKVGRAPARGGVLRWKKGRAAGGGRWSVNGARNRAGNSKRCSCNDDVPSPWWP